MIRQERANRPNDRDAQTKGHRASCTLTVAQGLPESDVITPGEEVKMQSRRYYDNDEGHGGGKKKSEERCIIAATDTVIHPLTVMIAAVDTIVAEFAMSRSWWTVCSARRAIFDAYDISSDL